MKGRKIPSKYENPIDDKLINVADKCIPFCIKYKITPNFITIIRLLLSFKIIHLLFYTNETLMPILGSLVFYFLDCLDGHLARATDQITVIGDYLDHFSDIFFYISIFVFISFKNYNNKLLVIFIYLLFTYLSLIHLGLQQLKYKEILIGKKLIIPNINHTNYTDHDIESMHTDLGIISKDMFKYITNIDSEILDLFSNMHKLSSNDIIWTKYFGNGTLCLVIYIIIYYVQTHTF